MQLQLVVWWSQHQHTLRSKYKLSRFTATFLMQSRSITQEYNLKTHRLLCYGWGLSPQLKEASRYIREADFLYTQQRSIGGFVRDLVWIVAAVHSVLILLTPLKKSDATSEHERTSGCAQNRSNHRYHILLQYLLTTPKIHKPIHRLNYYILMTSVLLQQVDRKEKCPRTYTPQFSKLLM